MKNSNTNRGISILGILILAVIVLLVLSYFNINVKSVVQSPTAQDNIHYVAGGTKSFWDTYLEAPASYLWNDVWVKLFWRPFISNIENINAGKPTVFDSAAKNLEVQQPNTNQ